MLKFTVETAAFADAIKAAAGVAPTKGPAFDVAGGIMVESIEGELVVRATDRNTTFLRRFPRADVQVEGTIRFSTSSFVPLIASLPLDGTEVTVERTAEATATIACDTVRASIAIIPEAGFPAFGSFRDEPLAHVENFGDVVEHVSWATSKDGHPPLNGVHFTGTEVWATNKVSIAVAALEMPVDKPITVPLSHLSSILKRGPVRLGAAGEKLLMMPTDDTEISSVIYAVPYPNLDLMGQKITQCTNTFEMDRVAAAASVKRMMALSAHELINTVDVATNGDAGIMILTSEVKGVGKVSDEIEIGGINGDVDLAVRFKASELRGVLAAATSDTLEVSHTGTPHDVWKFTNPTFTALVMTMRKM